MKQRPRTYQVNDFLTPAAPANRIISVIHVMPGDDGGQPILDHLANVNEPRMIGGQVQPLPSVDLTDSLGRTFLIEVPYGKTSADIAAELRIPPRFMTTPIVIIPGWNGFFELDRMGVLGPVIAAERPVGFAVGDITTFSPDDSGKKRLEELSTKVRGFLNYIESRYQTPVLYVATGPTGPVIVDQQVRKYGW